MVTWMADYFHKRVKNVILKYTIERHWQSLNEETGGMNDVLYRLYYVTVCIILEVTLDCFPVINLLQGAHIALSCSMLLYY